MPAKIVAEFSDHFPTESAASHRDATRRRLFTQCVCMAENNGLGENFSVRREVKEEPEKQSVTFPHGYKNPELVGRHTLRKMTMTAVFEALP